MKDDLLFARLPDEVGPRQNTLGPADAPVTVIEYADLECPTCKQAAGAAQLLLDAHAHRVRFEFRHFPLTFAHPHAMVAAEAAEAAGAQGKFWAMHDLLFANQQHLGGHHLREYARRLALDGTRFDRELRGHLYLPRIRADIATGEASGLRAVPGFFVNGSVVDVSFGLDRLFDAVNAMLARID